jgi:hypothetical protein
VGEASSVVIAHLCLKYYAEMLIRCQNTISDAKPFQ